MHLYAELMREANRIVTVGGATSIKESARVLIKWYKLSSMPKDLAAIDQTLLCTRETRRRQYTRLITDSFKDVTTDQNHSNVWATDGSPVTTDDKRSTTSAVVGPRETTLKIAGQYTSSLHG